MQAMGEDELRERLRALPGWRVETVDGVRRLRKTYRFDDFSDALGFTVAVGKAAEEVGHHPAILTEWGMVTVEWWTHKIPGLGVDDATMAARTDRLYENADGKRG